MSIDVPYFIIILLAVYKGYSKGLIVAIFSFAALVIGLAAAMKLSTVAAHWLSHHTQIKLSWLPFLSFALVFICFVYGLKLIASLLQKSVEFLLMGWANKLGGAALYAMLYTMIFSVVLFYALQLKVLNPHSVAHSACYGFVKPWAPFVINGIGAIFPIFKDMFTQLEHYFEQTAAQLNA